MTAAAAAALAGPLVAGPAFAHVEVSADKDRAGAADVTLTVHGEAESDDAGIRSERVVLPDGIAPADVSLVDAPSGWAFRRTADGFTVGGKALEVGADAEWSVTVAKLPDGETRLSFRTLETYGDGEVSRWIEIQEPGQDEPDNPAPLVTLKAARATASASPSASPSTPPSAAPSAEPQPAPTLVAADPVEDDGSSLWWVWVLVGVVLVGVVAAVVAARRRRS
jgi:uncharacterized protein YcnI